MPTKVYLIGTIHCDLKGSERLEKLLNLYKPDVIIKECGPDKPIVPEHLNDLPQDELIKILKEKNPNIDVNYKTLCMVLLNGAYEDKISDGYSKRNNIKILTIDDPVICNGIVKETTDITKNVNINTLADFRLSPNEFIKNTDFEYKEHRIALPNEAGTVREILWENEVRRHEGVIVGIFGLLHIYGKHHNLYDRLSDLDVERILLCDSDKIQPA